MEQVETVQSGVKLVGRYTRHEHGFTRLVLRYSDGRRETAWFDGMGRRWHSSVAAGTTRKKERVEP